MNAEQIVRKINDYMVERGIAFRTLNTNNTLRAILNGGTSTGYKKSSKHNQSGVVFYCYKDEIDKNALAKSFNLTVYENSKPCRPFTL